VVENGWYYDFDRDEPFTPEDLGLIEKEMKAIINERDPVRTEVWDRARAIDHYVRKNEPFKVELIEAIPATSRCACIGTATGRISAGARTSSTPAIFRRMPSS